jgi:NADH:ubiquinone reductase (non-electrogenic)
LAGTATGTVAPTSIMEPIRWYCDQPNSASPPTYIQAECVGLDMQTQTVKCIGVTDSIPPFSVKYDHLIVAVGAEPATFNIPGVKEYATFMKEVEDGIAVKRQILQKLENASSLLAAGASDDVIAKELTWLIIGGGPTGVELTAEITDFMNADVKKYFPKLASRIRVILVEAFPRVLGMFDEKLSSYATESLRGNGAQVLCNAMVTKVTDSVVELKIKSTPPATSPAASPTAPAPASAPASTATAAPPTSTTTEHVPYGALVWAGGITMRPITRAIAAAAAPGTQTSRFGLEVDAKFLLRGGSTAVAPGGLTAPAASAASVPGAVSPSAAGPEAETAAAANKPSAAGVGGNVWAIGDCAVVAGCAPTAQAATQQGKYLGSLFRDTILLGKSPDGYHDFVFSHKGVLAYVGSSRGIAELKNLWDVYPVVNGQMKVEGAGAFAIWRSLYFSKLLSSRNQAQVAFDWFKNWMFGRDISTPLVVVDTSKENDKKKN